jgi:hypothetical protein
MTKITLLSLGYGDAKAVIKSGKEDIIKIKKKGVQNEN